MIAEIRLPEISENVESGDVVKLLVNAGDTVVIDQPLIELETEKAVFEVPATSAGVVKEITVSVGDSVDVGAVIAVIETDAAGDAKAPPPATAEKAPAAASPPPPTAEITIEAAPVPEPTTADVEAAVAVAARTATAAAAAPTAKRDPAPASPTVRRLARELGVDIHNVQGAGAGGRISSDDVHKFAKTIIVGAVSAPSTAPAPPLPDFSKYGEIMREPMSKIRKVTARNMARTWNTVPAVTQNDEADITEIEVARKKYSKLAESAGGKITMTAILLKVCASALKRFPEFNASIDVAKSEIVMKRYFNIGVAVDTERGLLVPVIKNVDSKNIVDLAVELPQIAKKARDRKLTPGEMEGTNFTISNLGGIGGTSFSPIVNTPEVAILGVSRGKMQPVYQDGGFVPRMVMPLSLSYDHRLIDGAAAARFLRWICEALENPILLAIDG